MRDFLWLRRILLTTFFIMVAVIVFYHANVDAKSKKVKARFYDFSDQLIDGTIKKPSTIWIRIRNSGNSWRSRRTYLGLGIKNSHIRSGH